MARDLKVIQRGMNAQDNDLALPAGTPIYALNAEYSRDGVIERRRGFESFWNGIPKASVEDYNKQGKFHELFTGQHLFTDTNGMMFSYDEVDPVPAWKSVPFNMPHQFRFIGDGGVANTFVCSMGRMLIIRGQQHGTTNPLIFNWQQGTPDTTFIGTIANDVANAQISSASQNAKFRTAFDIVGISNTQYISDDTTIRTNSGAVLAGVIGTPGSANGTGAAASFSAASWMATDGTSIYVADNVNQIRKVTTGGVVTLLAGSTTAGDIDGLGAAARFRNISGMAYSGGFLYVSEGTAAHRIRKVDVTTASVTIYAGSLTPTSGYVDAVGTTARFNTPTGIEAIGTSLYVGDSGNSRIRQIIISSASVTTYAGTTYSTPALGVNLVGGPVTTAILPGVVLRGKYTSLAVNGGLAQTYLSLECTASNSSTDLAIVSLSTDITDRVVHHYARCPSASPTQTTGPNKLDTVGPNAYSPQLVRSADFVGGVVFTTSDKPRSIDLYSRINAYDSMPRLRPLGIEAPEAPLTAAVTTGTLPFSANTAVAYRTVNGLKLPDGRVILGPPSPRIIQSSSVAWSGSVTAYPAPALPYDGMAFVQLYRTKSGPSTTDPGDQMFLCYETPITYGNGVIISDIMDDALLGAELITNATQQGAAYTPLPPPTFCNEVASFNNSAVLANYNDKAFVRVRMLGVSGLVNGTSTVTFTTTGPCSTDACTTFTATAAAAENIPLKQFANVTAGSAGTNAVNTAKSIVNVINRNPDAFMFRAVYDESDPGAFYVYSWHPGQTNSQLVPIFDAATFLITGYTTTQSTVTFTTNTSVNFVATGQVPSLRGLNSVAYSDQYNSDSWPVVQQQTLSASQEPIQRLLPIAETLIAIKQNSVWRYDTSFTEQIYDTSLHCDWPDSFAKIGNSWIGMFTAGFMQLSASSAQDVGHSIQRIVLPYTVNVPNSTGTFYGYGTSIQNRNLYVCSFGLPSLGAVLAATTRTFAYNTQQQSWSEWIIDTSPGVTGIGIPGSYLGCIVSNIGVGFSSFSTGQSILRQRDYRRNANVFQYEFDYSDVTISLLNASLSADGRTLTATIDATTAPLGYATTNPSGGGFPMYPECLSGAAMGFSANTSIALVSSASITGSTLTAYSEGGFGGASQVLRMPIAFEVVYAPTFAPANDQFGDVVVTMERIRGGSITATFLNRNDGADSISPPYGNSPFVANRLGSPYVGPFSAGSGFSRTNVMASKNQPIFTTTPSVYLCDVQRFATPAERANDLQLIFSLLERKAVAPFSLKSCMIDYDNSTDGKVKR